MDSAYLKVKRAEKHYTELEYLFKKKRPFGYFLETNCKTGEKSTFAKRNEDVANEASLIIGDILHNLRSSIDHAYWNCTEVHAKSDDERKRIQFPITQTETHLTNSILPKISSMVSEDFAQTVARLNPYREGGNALLCAIHDLDVIDKHKLLIPTGNFTKISSSMIQRLVPDFPAGLTNCGFGNNHRDVTWHCEPMTWIQRRKSRIPSSNMIYKELDVPVEIVIGDIDQTKPALEVLRDLINMAKNTIRTLYSAVGIKVEQAL